MHQKQFFGVQPAAVDGEPAFLEFAWRRQPLFRWFLGSRLTTLAETKALISEARKHYNLACCFRFRRGKEKKGGFCLAALEKQKGFSFCEQLLPCVYIHVKGTKIQILRALGVLCVCVCFNLANLERQKWGKDF